MSTLDPVSDDVTAASMESVTLVTSGLEPLSAETLRLLTLKDCMQRILIVFIKYPLCVVGVCFNVIAALLLWKRALRKSTFNYLFCLAVVDALYLLYAPQFGFVRTVWGVDLQKMVGCNVHWGLVNVTRQVSSWLLAVCCAERALTVAYPSKAAAWFSPRRARVAIAVILLLLPLAAWHNFGGLATDYDTPISRFYETCNGRTPWLSYYYYKVFPKLMLTLYAFLPFLTLFIANAVIIKHFVGARNKVSALNAPTTMAATSKRVTLMSVVLSATFFVTMMPLMATLLAFRSYTGSVSLNEMLIAEMAVSVTTTVSFLNHCINLWVYLSLSKSFRADMKSVMRCKLRLAMTPAEVIT